MTRTSLYIMQLKRCHKGGLIQGSRLTRLQQENGYTGQGQKIEAYNKPRMTTTIKLFLIKRCCKLSYTCKDRIDLLQTRDTGFIPSYRRVLYLIFFCTTIGHHFRARCTLQWRNNVISISYESCIDYFYDSCQYNTPRIT